MKVFSSSAARSRRAGSWSSYGNGSGSSSSVSGGKSYGTVAVGSSSGSTRNSAGGVGLMCEWIGISPCSSSESVSNSGSESAMSAIFSRVIGGPDASLTGVNATTASRRRASICRKALARPISQPLIASTRLLPRARALKSRANTRNAQIDHRLAKPSRRQCRRWRSERFRAATKRRSNHRGRSEGTRRWSRQHRMARPQSLKHNRP